MTAPPAAGDALPSITLAPVSAATTALDGAASSSAGGASWMRRPAVDHADAPGERGRVLERVGDQQGGEPEAGEQRAELVPDLAAGDRVQRGERLVEQQHPRLAGERARQRHALTLAARQLGRPRRSQVRDPDALEQIGAVAPAGEADVPGDGQVREQPVVLGDVADAALLGREVGRRALRRTTTRRRARCARPGAARARRRRGAAMSCRHPRAR